MVIGPDSVRSREMPRESGSGTDSDLESSAFEDAGTDRNRDSSTGRKRQASVPEMVKVLERKKRKRRESGKSTPRKSPEASALADLAVSGGVNLNSETLEVIKRMIDTGIGKVIESMEKQFESMQNRITILESENMDKDAEIRRLSQRLESSDKIVKELTDQVESLDMNGRSCSLIVTCSDFGPRAESENIEEKTVKILDRRFPDMQLSRQDFQVVHRLKRDDKVICKFARRAVRDQLYERRFELADRRRPPGPGPDQTASSGRREMAPLFLNESLTAAKLRIYNALLDARKEENGKKVYTVFSRRGFVYCKRQRGGENIRVDDERRLLQLIDRGAAVASLTPPQSGGAPPGEAARVSTNTRASVGGGARATDAGAGRR